MQIAAIHTDEAVAAPEGSESIGGEPAIAQQEAAGPPRFVFYLGVEGTQRRRVNQSIRPFCLEQIGIASRDEAVTGSMRNGAGAVEDASGASGVPPNRSMMRENAARTLSSSSG